MATTIRGAAWPELDLDAWEDTRDTLHMWTQVAGKVRLELAPKINHWWHVPLYVTARGLTTSPIPYRDRTFELEFDFVEHVLHVLCSDGAARRVALAPRTTADFYAEVMARLREVGVEVDIYTTPVEVPDPIPFEKDTVHASYDAEYANRFWRALAQGERVMQEFRGRFLGKCSPVHFFWGSFDLAVTRFSGRAAPPHPGVPGVPDAITREAYSHEVSSAGFWPGGGAARSAYFYSYAYPEPEGLAAARVGPAEAFWSGDFREFLLPYDAVRTVDDPDARLTEFLQTTYEAAADLLRWDRAALECAW
ncbi:MAG TPA: DUF5996 family protein [Longimicrobium sp.]|jgi:hypothetical protein